MRTLASILCLLITLHAPALRAQAAVEVDMELVLAVDVSRSMSRGELEIQRRGYAEALTSPEVLAAIQGGFTGRIGLTYVEWAGDRSQRILVDWTLIETAEDAADFAAWIVSSPQQTMRRTSISGALEFARAHLQASPFETYRRVIDISGDGPNNQGIPVVEARDRALAEDITINGLPIMAGEAGTWGIDDLDIYYMNCVIGGPASFMLPVWDWSQFAAAIRRKLVLEIAGRRPEADAPPAESIPRQVEGYDCLVGEKIWQRRRSFDDTF